MTAAPIPAAPEIPLADLVGRARSGQSAAMEELLQRCHRRIFALAFQMLGSGSEAEDAAQDALLRIYLRLCDLRDPDRFWPWALRVASNSFRDLLRKQTLKSVNLDEIESVLGPDDPARSAQESELRGQVKKALNRLSLPLRLVAVLRDVEGFSTQEVAEALDLPAGTVKSRLFEARRQLREYLGEEDVDPHG